MKETVNTCTPCKARILLIGFDPIQLDEPLSKGLRLHGYETTEISEPIGALEHIYGMKGVPPDLLVINLDLMHRSGMEMIKIVRVFRPGFPIIASKAAKNVSGTDDLEASGIPVIGRPIDLVQLDKDIQALLVMAKTVREGTRQV